MVPKNIYFRGSESLLESNRVLLKSNVFGVILPADRFVIGDLMSVSDKTEQTRRVQMEADGESMGRSRDRVA